MLVGGSLQSLHYGSTHLLRSHLKSIVVGKLRRHNTLFCQVVLSNLKILNNIITPIFSQCGNCFYATISSRAVRNSYFVNDVKFCYFLSADYVKYLNSEVQYFYYQKIKDSQSQEHDVDIFWLNLLPDYFQKKLRFGIENEVRMLPGILKQRAGWIIRCIRMGDTKRVILMTGKWKSLETQNSAWADALDQITRYMTLLRTESGQDANQTLHAAINIGTHTRFYQLRENDISCVDYPGTERGEPLELARDEERIHNILMGLSKKTSH